MRAKAKIRDARIPYEVPAASELAKRLEPVLRVGSRPYTLQVAIASVHARAPDAGATDGRQIVVLYDALLHLERSPVIKLNRAVAVAMRDGRALELTGQEAERRFLARRLAELDGR